jgi:hypothetical protein
LSLFCQMILSTAAAVQHLRAYSERSKSHQACNK